MTDETPDVVSRARAALDGITPGQWWWTAETRPRLIALGDDKHELTDAREIIRCAALLHPGHFDAAFIAAAPDLVRDLLATVERLRAQIATGCQCSEETGCGEGMDGGCVACMDNDVYAPCPTFGFMCSPDDGRCECCSPAQQEMTRRHYERKALRTERDEARAAVMRVIAVCVDADLESVSFMGEPGVVKTTVIRGALEGEA